MAGRPTAAAGPRLRAPACIALAYTQLSRNTLCRCSSGPGAAGGALLSPANPVFRTWVVTSVLVILKTIAFAWIAVYFACVVCV
jgi:hypothetical protein